MMVLGREIEVTNRTQELDCRRVLLDSGVSEAAVYFYEGKEKIWIGRSVYAERLPSAIK